MNSVFHGVIKAVVPAKYVQNRQWEVREEEFVKTNEKTHIFAKIGLQYKYPSELIATTKTQMMVSNGQSKGEHEKSFQRPSKEICFTGYNIHRLSRPPAERI